MKLATTRVIYSAARWLVCTLQSWRISIRLRRTEMFRRVPNYCAIVLVILEAGCAPKDRSMPVAYIKDGYAMYGVKPDTWDYGEVKECQIASRSTQRPDERGDLLLCGAATMTAWGMSWLRPDFKSQIYQNARTFAVTFRSAGHSSRFHDTRWWCQRRPESINCD